MSDTITYNYGYPWWKSASFGESKLADFLRREHKELKPLWETVTHRPDPSSRRYRIVFVVCRRKSNGSR